METFPYFYRCGLLLFLLFFFSCQEQKEIKPDEKKQNISNDKDQKVVWIENQILNFQSTEDFYSYINGKSLSNGGNVRRDFPEFTSLKDVYTKIPTNLNIDDSNSLLKSLRNKYGEKLKIYLNNGQLEIDVFSSAISNVINPEGQVIIGGHLFIFSRDNIIYYLNNYKLNFFAISQPVKNISVTKKVYIKQLQNARVGPFNEYLESDHYNGWYIEAFIVSYTYTFPFYQGVNLRYLYPSNVCDDPYYIPSYDDYGYIHTCDISRMSIEAYMKSRSQPNQYYSFSPYSVNWSINWQFNVQGSENRTYYNECADSYENSVSVVPFSYDGPRNGSYQYQLENASEGRKATIYDGPPTSDLTSFSTQFSGPNNKSCTITW